MAKKGSTMMTVDAGQNGRTNANEVEGFIGKTEVAKRLGKHVRTVETWMREGVLPYYKVRHAVVFRWSEVVEGLKKCRVARS
jgi:excisionase family DNA binding protein